MVTLAESLHTSRRSILAGSFLTPARNIQLSSVVKRGVFQLKYACHTFNDTKLCTAAIFLAPVTTVRPVNETQSSSTQSGEGDVATTSTSAQGTPIRPPQASQKGANTKGLGKGSPEKEPNASITPTAPPAFVYELVLCFKENPKSYFLVPRDAILEINPDVVNFHFLTLRQAGQSSPLQQQSISLKLFNVSPQVIAHLRGHVRAQNEVRSKLASAVLHIEKMPLVTLEYDDPKRPQVRPVAITLFQADPASADAPDESSIADVSSTSTVKRKRPGKRHKATTTDAVASDGPAKTKRTAKWRSTGVGSKCTACGTAQTSGPGDEQQLVCDKCGPKVVMDETQADAAINPPLEASNGTDINA